ncbi:dimethyl sulfoxide reductase anchor subunit family protein [Photobacterium sanguinicancri]|uniref:Dimethyl sulfoxide reductase anchor subunit n=1 Tax=Photobacterium sanguinicancri TaxID=875932 RepID=A0AAW7Y609_9GAMM|nr:DmsC/YnfH family molybdoenzyme membrane anchor subunit [Photobacterium sanguinicancri]MDO6542758.1 dimethyl sulfoxide reductase anchor subunit [Photobacterium sanguinicancri]
MSYHELSLVLFTVLAQTAVGAYLIMTLANLVTNSRVDVKGRITRNMFFVWVVMGLGFVASSTHLGSPMRAMNALNQVGTSWLSNEILTGSMFFAFGGLYWLLEVLDKGTEGARKGLKIAGMVAGVAFMYSMVNVYLIDTVPTWNTPFTGWSFLLTMVVAGAIFASTLMHSAQFDDAKYTRGIQGLVVVAIIAMIVVTLSQMVALADIQSSVVAARDLVPNMAMLQGSRIVLLVAGAAIALFGINRIKGSVALPVVGLALVLVAELLGRNIFFNLHMTVGM